MLIPPLKLDNIIVNFVLLFPSCKSRFFFLIIQVFCFKKTKKTPVLLVFYALFAY